MSWRTITAQQFMDGTAIEDGIDEVFVRHPDTGKRTEVWDVGFEHDEFGNVVLFTAATDQIFVTPNTPIEVR